MLTITDLDMLFIEIACDLKGVDGHGKWLPFVQTLLSSV